MCTHKVTFKKKCLFSVIHFCYYYIVKAFLPPFSFLKPFGIPLPSNSSNLWSLLEHISSDYADLLPQPSNLTLSICLSHQHWRQSSYWKSRWPQQQRKGQVIFSLPHVRQFPFPSFKPCPVVDNPTVPVFPLFFYSLDTSQILAADSAFLSPRVLAQPNYFFHISKQRNTVYAGSPVATNKGSSPY